MIINPNEVIILNKKLVKAFGANSAIVLSFYEKEELIPVLTGLTPTEVKGAIENLKLRGVIINNKISLSGLSRAMADKTKQKPAKDVLLNKITEAPDNMELAFKNAKEFQKIVQNNGVKNGINVTSADKATGQWITKFHNLEKSFSQENMIKIFEVISKNGFWNIVRTPDAIKKHGETILMQLNKEKPTQSKEVGVSTIF